MTPVYSRLLLQYLYNPKNENLKLHARKLLQTNAEARIFFGRIKRSYQLLNEAFPLPTPRKSVIENILKYAAC